MPKEHVPVLAQVLLEHIDLRKDAAIVVDTTVGLAGHSKLLGQMLDKDGTLLGLDVDEGCLAAAKSELASLGCKVILACSNFADLATQLEKHSIGKVDLILADLGVCSAQLTDPKRGLSFQEDMPLDMRLDRRLKKTAADIVNKTGPKDLADLIFNYGQERASRKIARFIAQYRDGRKFRTTGELASVICQAVGVNSRSRKSKIHPATRTFQALRIAVNDELANLQKLLDSAPGVLAKDGLIAIISFHSLEDRLVKLNFKLNNAANIYEIATKKPIIASRDEILENPRARSAKLRIARKK